MKSTDPRFIDILHCPNCQTGKLISQENHLACQQCRTAYPIRNSAPFLIHNELIEQYKKYQQEIESPVNRLKTLIKKLPWLFSFLTYAIGSISFFGWSPKKTLKKLYRENELGDKIIINLGSGTETVHPEVINLDIFPFKNVNLVTDATKLSINDNAVDMIITQSTLEHVPNAELAIKEICRVVKPGGFVYVSIPFLMPFHASPNDYFRLTNEGLKRRFAAFEQRRVGMNGGPASALVSFLMHFLALPFSIISTGLYNFMTYIIMAILSPLRILDLVFYLFPKSMDAAAMTYFIGKKKG